MKYKEKSELCSKGCGRKRVRGQRYCRECRAVAQRDFRKKSAEPGELVERAVKQVKAGRGKVDPDFLAKLEGLAIAVKEQLDQFNAGVGSVTK